MAYCAEAFEVKIDEKEGGGEECRLIFITLSLGT